VGSRVTVAKGGRMAGDCKLGWGGGKSIGLTSRMQSKLRCEFGFVRGGRPAGIGTCLSVKSE